MELKPCPFCGGPAEFAHGGYWGGDCSRSGAAIKTSAWFYPRPAPTSLDSWRRWYGTAELAEAVSVSPVVFSRYINDRRGVPISILFSLAEEMRADLRDLISEVDE